MLNFVKSAIIMQIKKLTGIQNAIYSCGKRNIPWFICWSHDNSYSFRYHHLRTRCEKNIRRERKKCMVRVNLKEKKKEQARTICKSYSPVQKSVTNWNILSMIKEILQEGTIFHNCIKVEYPLNLMFLADLRTEYQITATMKCCS